LGPGDSDASVVDRVLAMRVIAVVGCSPKPERAGYYVPAYLKRQGYRVVPVNPGHDEILGEKCYASLAENPFPVDVVEVFRRSENVPPVVDQAIAVKAKAVWLQSGITNAEAEDKARKAGLLVVSDACMLVEHRLRCGGV
jgi:predicted CoA-binding protein